MPKMYPANITALSRAVSGPVFRQIGEQTIPDFTPCGISKISLPSGCYESPESLEGWIGTDPFFYDSTL